MSRLARPDPIDSFNLRARSALAALAAGLALATAPGLALGAPAPARVMSINLCGDQLTMLLLPPGRITSVSYLARERSATADLRARARRLRVNHGLAEEVLADRPDLIVASRFTSPATRRLARRLGAPLVELDAAESFDDVRVQLRLLGDAVGERARAEAWIARMDATLAELARTAPARPIRAVGWDAAGRAPGRRSLFGEVLHAAGGDNLAAAAGSADRTLDVEGVLRLAPAPQVLLYGVSSRTRVGERAQLQAHPALSRAFGGRRLAYPEDGVACGLPFAADMAGQLRQAMRAAVPPEPAR